MGKGVEKAQELSSQSLPFSSSSLLLFFFFLGEARVIHSLFKETTPAPKSTQKFCLFEALLPGHSWLPPHQTLGPQAQAPYLL